MPRKDANILIRLSEADKELVELAAKSANMSMSEFIREVVIGVSSATADYSTGALEYDVAKDIISHRTTGVLKSVKREE